MPTVEEIFEGKSPPDYSEEDSDAEPDADDPADDPDRVEPGDQVFMTTVHNPAEFIQATATTSQRLAEAFTRNSAPPKSFHESVPSQFHDFEDVFSKLSFDALPDRKPWDHAIELEAGAKASSPKVYPLSPNEQTELDAFIEENLASGRIHLSKSPMAAPVFFTDPTGPGLPGIECKNGKECISTSTHLRPH